MCDVRPCTHTFHTANWNNGDKLKYDCKSNLYYLESQGIVATRIYNAAVPGLSCLKQMALWIS